MKELKTRQVYLSITLILLFGSLFFLSYLFYASAQARLPHLAELKEPPNYLTSIAGTVDEPIDRPTGVATRDGLVYVVNNDPGRIDVFRPNGKRVRSFFAVSKGTGSNLMGIAIGKRKELYITDLSNDTIKVYSDDGTYQNSFPKASPGAVPNLIFEKPLNISIRGNNLYIMDEHKLRVFGRSGIERWSVGGKGKGMGEFDFPYAAAAGMGRVYVADANNARVQILDKKGVPIGMFENYPKGGMLLPRGIATDNLGRVHVVDNMAGKVLVYDKTGKFLTEYGKGSGLTKEEGLVFPNNIAISHEDRLIYITDTGNNRVAVYGY